MSNDNDDASPLADLQARLAAAGVTDDASLQAALERDPSLQQDIEAALRADPEVPQVLAVQALVERFINVEDSEQVIEFWRGVPTQLEQPFIAAIEEILAEAPPGADPVSLENLRERLAAFRRLCEQAQHAEAAPASTPPLLVAVQAFISARTWPESQHVVEEHPELLSDEALTALDGIVAGARHQGDQQAVAIFTEHRDLLRRCRDVGVSEAFDEKTRSALPESAASSELAGIMEELRRPADRTQMNRRADLCRQALALVDRETQPAFWVALQGELGNSLAQSLTGDRAANLERAIGAYEEALTVRTREAMPIEWATTTMNLANAYYSRIRGDRADNLERAIGAYEEALTVFQPDALPDYCRRTARGLARLCFAEGRYAKCAAAARLTFKANDALLQTSLLRSSKESELREVQGLAALAGYALGTLRRASEAAETLEQGRARMLGEALEARRRDIETLPDAKRRRYAQAAESVERLRAAMGAPAPQDQAERPKLDQLRRELELAQGELNDAIAAIRDLPGYEDFFAPVSFARIQAQARPDRPLAYLATTSRGAVIALVWPDRAEALLSDFDEARLNGLLVETDAAGESVSGGYLPAQMGQSDWLSPALGELMAPLAVRLREHGAKGVVLVPSGRLGLLPLHAAHFEANGTQRCLLDEFDVSYAPSAQSLAAARRNAEDRADLAFHLAGVGNPLPLPDSVPPLAYAKPELQSIAELLPKGSVTALMEHSATRPALSRALRQATVAHLACHGNFAFDQPLDSGLHLGNGTLTLRTILDEPEAFASVRLAVLSACQSSVTDFANLPDEAIGLPAGLVQAGVPAVVGTLWSVNDESTALLMVRYYELMLTGSLPPCQALGAAQRWLRDLNFAELDAYLARHDTRAQARRELVDRMSASLSHPLRVRVILSDDPKARPFADPRYWAPFTFTGATEVSL